MSSFNSSRRDRKDSDKPRGNKKTSARSSEKSGNSRAKYKAGRSFSKNKSFRENPDLRGSDAPKRRFDSDGEKKFDRPYKKSFGSERTFNKDEKPRRNFDKEKKSFDKPFKSSRDEKPKRPFDKDRERKSFHRDDEKPKRNFSRDDDKKSFDKPRERKPFGRERNFERNDEKPKRNFEKSRETKSFHRDNEKPKRNFSRDDNKKSFDKPRERKPFGGERSFERNDEKPKRDFEKSRETNSFDKPRKNKYNDERIERNHEEAKRVKFEEFEEGKAFSHPEKKDDYKSRKPTEKPAPAKKINDDGLIRLNKYLSNAGVASRREADNLILSGTVKVNGVVVDQLGYKINPNDKVSYGDAAVKSERKVYLLLNKPKDYITTLDDPQERKTVMELLKGACRERVYPVGRLDRNTTGILLFTNDGELTTKLTHPKFGIKKVYHVTLNKGLKTEDFSAITEGVELEDGMIKADEIAFVGEGKKDIGIEIHSGRNRIVRRLFEHLGYDVLKLDRVTFAGLTKKDLPRGKYRFLTAKEISFLKMMG